MCPSHSLVTSGVFKIQNVSSCGLQMSLSYPSPRADVPKCQIHPLQVSTSHWTPSALLMGQHLMAKKAGLSPLQSATQPSSGAQTNPYGWPHSGHCTSAPKECQWREGEAQRKIFHRAMVFLRGQEQHRVVYLLGETWRLQQLQ